MQLGWVDFSKEDRQKALDVINLLQEQGAVDELGIGIIRDAFSNYFFPGTSTVQTRAKYFLIVPYLLKEAGDGRFGKNFIKIMDSINKEEKKIAWMMIEADSSADGIIGKRVLPKGWVSRVPSDIYWNGIKRYGIFKDNDSSISNYISTALFLKMQKDNSKVGKLFDSTEDTEKDDNDAGDIQSFRFWDLPVYKPEWRENLSIKLTQEEAIYLKVQIEKTTPGTLLSFILKNNVLLDEYDSFEALYEDLKDKVDPELSYIMKLACEFNNLIYLARVRYNIILSEGKNDEAVYEWEWLKDDLSYRASVNLTEVFDKLNLSNSRTYAFLSMLQEFFINGDIEQADALIRKREIQLKGINRAKLNRAGEFDPNRWVGGGLLDYRFKDARRIINDIYNGEVNTDV